MSDLNNWKAKLQNIFAQLKLKIPSKLMKKDNEGILEEGNEEQKLEQGGERELAETETDAQGERDIEGEDKGEADNEDEEEIKGENQTSSLKNFLEEKKALLFRVGAVAALIILGLPEVLEMLNEEPGPSPPQKVASKRVVKKDKKKPMAPQVSKKVMGNQKVAQSISPPSPVTQEQKASPPPSVPAGTIAQKQKTSPPPLVPAETIAQKQKTPPPPLVPAETIAQEQKAPPPPLVPAETIAQKQKASPPPLVPAETIAQKQKTPPPPLVPAETIAQKQKASPPPLVPAETIAREQKKLPSTSPRPSEIISKAFPSSPPSSLEKEKMGEIKSVESPMPTKEKNEKKNDALEALSNLVKKMEPQKLEYTDPPQYERLGRGLVYNCKGKHWACVDKFSYFQCRENFLWLRSNQKPYECIIQNVYASIKDCEIVQEYNINKAIKTDFCEN